MTRQIAPLSKPATGVRAATKESIFYLRRLPRYESADVLGEALGITGGGLRKIQNGDNGPGLDTLERISRLASHEGINHIPRALTSPRYALVPAETPPDFVRNGSPLEELARLQQAHGCVSGAILQDEDPFAFIARMRRWLNALEIEVLGCAAGISGEVQVPAGDGLPNPVNLTVR